MNDQKQLMNIFAQAYQLIAKASKQQPSQEGFQQILEMLGEEGIKECAKVADQGPEAVAQAIVQIIQQKQAQKAANGAKLRYIMQLQGKCKPGYLKKGGRCKPCEMAEGVFRNKADIFYEGGYISGYRNSQNNLKKKVQEDAMTRTEGVPLNGKVYGTERWPIRINPGITVNSKVGNKAGESSLSISDYRKQNQRLKERLYQEDRTRTEGVRDKDGKVRGTERYPRRLPELTVTNKTTKKKQEGGSIWNKLYGAITNEGVNGIGTRFNPVELPEVSVQSTKRYPFDVDRRSTNLGNGYSIISDAIFDSYGNDLTGYKGDLEPIRGLRTIYITPSGRDTIYQNYNPNYQYSTDSSYPRERWISYESGYMPIASGSGDKKTFNRLLKKTTPDSRKKARIK